MTTIEECFSGKALYGDDFTDAQIAEWFADEEKGYFNITQGAAQSRPEYDSMYEMALFRHIRGRSFETCLGIGSAGGQDVRHIAPMFKRFIIVEPATEMWRDRIGGTPSSYRSPNLRGELDIESETVDVVTAISSLHHIPNVSDVLREAHRVLRPGGYILVHEPTTAMGDWRKQRVGVTKNERGLPEGWLLDKLAEIGFEVERVTPCHFAPFTSACHKLGILPYQHDWSMRIDLLASRLMNWNARYYRPSFLRKFAPASVGIVARKKAAGHA